MEKEMNEYMRELDLMEEGRAWVVAHPELVVTDENGFRQIVSGAGQPEAADFYISCKNEWLKKNMERARVRETMLGSREPFVSEEDANATNAEIRAFNEALAELLNNNKQ